MAAAALNRRGLSFPAMPGGEWIWRLSALILRRAKASAPSDSAP